MANCNELWTELCKDVFGVTPLSLTPPPDPTRKLYIMSHLTLREMLSLRSNGTSVSSRWNNNMIQVPSFRG